MVHADNNAMTEVALALAMAFFAIFVLAAVSMSQPSLTRPQSTLQDQNTLQDLEQNLVQPPEKSVHKINMSAASDGERALAANETFLVFHKARFYDARLKPFSMTQKTGFAGNPDRHYVVGVLPSLSMAEMIRLKREKNIPNLAITLLNTEWQQRLELLK